MSVIHHTFAPHVDGQFLRRSLSLLIQPWQWKTGAANNQLKQELERRFSKKAFLFSTGREALFALLQSMDIPSGSEVIVQGYTCVVVPNAITAAGLRPVFADIDPETLNMDPASAESLITPKTKAVIVQHTFGIPGPLKALRELCDRHGLLLIEDCAHVLPDGKGPAGMLTTGDAAILSFGRDKAVSGITGGAVLMSGKTMTSGLEQLEKNVSHLSLFLIVRYLLYPLLYALSRPVYRSIGRMFLATVGRLGLLVPIVTGSEKQGRQDPVIHSLPNACAALALSELKRLEAINDRRRRLTSLYLDESKKRGWPLLSSITADLPLQKLPFFTKNAGGIRQKLKARGIHLHDGWTGCVICPSAVDPSACGYKDGDDPKAEMAGKQLLTLPTHPTMTIDQAKKLIEALDPLLP